MKNLYLERRIVLSALAVLALLTIFLSHDAYAFPPSPSGKPVPDSLTHRLIVKVKNPSHKLIAGPAPLGPGDLSALTRQFGAPEIEQLAPAGPALGTGLRAAAAASHPAANVFVFKFPEDVNTDSIRVELESQPWVEYVEYDRLMHLFNTPNDSLFAWQWGHENTGQTIPIVVRIDGPDNDTIAWVNGTPGADINFRAAYEFAGPRVPVIVGVIDTGSDTEHEDLTDNLWLNPGEIPDNAIDDDHNGYVDDYYGYDFSGDEFELPNEIIEDSDPTDIVGHGTHVAGIVAAVMDNTHGIAGISSDCQIMTIKAFPNAYFSVIARSIYYTVENGADILNLSFGGPYYSKTVSDALAYARGRGVLSITSSGNSGDETTNYPSADTAVIAVGALDYTGLVAEFSTYGSCLDLIAPGVSILSLRAAGTDLYAAGGEPNVHIVADKYLLADGTSMAAPYVAGCAAALLSIEGGLAPERLEEILRNSCVDLVDPYGLGESFPGWDKYSGYGRADLGRALDELAGVSLRILAPQADDVLSGIVHIEGSAYGPAFTEYQLDYGPGAEPSSWQTLITSDEPVITGSLANWNTSVLNGPYTLRLSTPSGHEDRVSFTLANTTVTSIISPEDGDTVSLGKTVRGTAIAPDFLSATVSLVSADDPENTEIVWSGTAPVIGDSICTWVINVEIDGWYYLKLRTETLGGSLTDSVSVYVTNPFHPGWPVDIPDYGFYSPVVDDLDGDGLQELVVPTRSGLFVFNSDGTLADGWPQDTSVQFNSIPAVANLDADTSSTKEIVITSENYVHVYTHDGRNYGKPQSIWPRAFAGSPNLYGSGIPLICDVKEDYSATGRPFILVIGIDGVVHVYNRLGVEQLLQPEYYPLIVQTTNTPYVSMPRATMMDLDCQYGPEPGIDGRNELVVAADGLWVWHAKSGKPYGGADNDPRIREYKATFGMAVGDFDGERGFEIAVTYVPVGSNIFHLDVLRPDGTSLPGWPISTGYSDREYLLHTLCAGDADGDGLPEIFLSPFFMGDGYILAYRADGTPLLPEHEDGAFFNLYGSSSPITLADLTGDKKPEIVLKAGDFFSGPELIYAFTSDGEFAIGYPIQYSNGFGTQLAAPLTADLDGDGYLNLFTLESSGMIAAVWDLPYPYSPAGRPWPKFRRDNWNTGILPAPYHVNSVFVVEVICYMLMQNCTAHFPPYKYPDADCNGRLDMLDLVKIVNYVYRNGPKPCIP